MVDQIYKFIYKSNLYKSRYERKKIKTYVTIIR